MELVLPCGWQPLSHSPCPSTMKLSSWVRTFSSSSSNPSSSIIIVIHTTAWDPLPWLPLSLPLLTSHRSWITINALAHFTFEVTWFGLERFSFWTTYLKHFVSCLLTFITHYGFNVWFDLFVFCVELKSSFLKTVNILRVCLRASPPWSTPDLTSFKKGKLCKIHNVHM